MKLLFREVMKLLIIISTIHNDMIRPAYYILYSFLMYINFVVLIIRLTNVTEKEARCNDCLLKLSVFVTCIVLDVPPKQLKFLEYSKL